MRYEIIDKLKSKAGESITEVLVSLLISSLGMLILANMIAISAKLISDSRTKYENYLNSENKLVEQPIVSPGHGGDVTIVVKNSSNQLISSDFHDNPISVEYYSSEFGGKAVISYKG